LLLSADYTTGLTVDTKLV